ncbi:MAG: hypothetical protein KC422_14095 [Trueperaceae bacterium]|nr:hypothetical protein [Trueperaceae bacterium]
MPDLSKYLPRLILVKQSVEEAQGLLSNPNDLDLIKIIWLTDMAIEMALASLVEMEGFSLKQKSRDYNFHDLLDAFLSGMNSPNLNIYKKLFTANHSIRNNVQHHGVIPSLHEAQKAVRDATAFLDEALQSSSLQKSLNEISFIDFIVFHEAKHLLKKSKELFISQDFTDSAQFASKAFDSGWLDFRISILEHKCKDLTYNYRSEPVWSDRILDSLIDKKSSSDKRGSLETLIIPLELSRYGIDFNEAINFIEIVPKFDRSPYGEKWFSIGEKRKYGIKEAGFFLNFASNALLRLQSHLQQTNTPITSYLVERLGKPLNYLPDLEITQ